MQYYIYYSGGMSPGRSNHPPTPPHAHRGAPSQEDHILYGCCHLKEANRGRNSPSVCTAASNMLKQMAQALPNSDPSKALADQRKWSVGMGWRSIELRNSHPKEGAAQGGTELQTYLGQKGGALSSTKDSRIARNRNYPTWN